jgi:DNA uptake protein ComE-like DNA-binding protein
VALVASATFSPPLIAAAADSAAKPAAVAASEPPHGVGAMKKKGPPPAPVKRVDINSASRKELKTLPGIGDVEAAKIIANRPYLTKTELVTKQVLPIGPYLSLKNQVVATPKDLPPPPAAKP